MTSDFQNSETRNFRNPKGEKESMEGGPRREEEKTGVTNEIRTSSGSRAPREEGTQPRR